MPVDRRTRRVVDDRGGFGPSVVDTAVRTFAMPGNAAVLETSSAGEPWHDDDLDIAAVQAQERRRAIRFFGIGLLVGGGLFAATVLILDRLAPGVALAIVPPVAAPIISATPSGEASTLKAPAERMDLADGEEVPAPKLVRSIRISVEPDAAQASAGRTAEQDR